MRIPPRLLLVFGVLILPGPAVGSLTDHKTLTIEGRTIDPEGFPIEKVKVRLQGARHASVVSNVDGQFSLKLPIGTPNDLRRSPLRVYLSAEKKGYRFGVPAGDDRLGLEIGLEVAGEGMGRCVARSNDERVAASAARIVALEGDAIGLVVVNFLGVKGEPKPSASLRLTNTAHAALPFAIEGPIHGLPPGPGVPDVTPEGSRSAWSILRGEDSSKSSEKTKDQDLKRRAAALADTAGRGVAAYAQATAAGDSSMEKWRDANWKPATSVAEPTATAQATKSTTSTPKTTTPQSTPSTSHGKDKRGSAVSAGDVIAPMTAAEVAAERVQLDRALPPAPTPSPTPATTKKSSPTITPQPSMSTGRGRSRPLVISNPPPGTKSQVDSCECRVEGTVEVQTVVPIRGPQKVEISFQWYPQLRDTVELFMGPPRPFKLPPGPCGPQRLRVRVLTDGRFDIVSREALSGFRCEGHRPYQPQLVLVTR